MQIRQSKKGSDNGENDGQKNYMKTKFHQASVFGGDGRKKLRENKVPKVSEKGKCPSETDFS